MKKEIISFILGVGVVGCIWAGTAFIKCQSPDKCSWLECGSKSSAGPLTLYPDE